VRGRKRLLGSLAFAGIVVGLMLAPAAGADAGEGAGAQGLALSGPGFHIHRGLRGETDVNVCSDAVSLGDAHCDAHVRTDTWARRPAPTGTATPGTSGDEGGYDPAYLQSAYNVAAAAAADGGGQGQTVAIVDAFNDPNVTSDLAHYRSYFGLPACPTGEISRVAGGCVFEKVNQNGSKVSLPLSNSGWATEISLDVEMVSAICSKCQILLVEANNTSLANLGTAVDEAVSLGANVVSNSYGGEEFAAESADTAAYYDHPGVPVVASAGDEGYGVEYPAASRDVVAVGGTSLTQLTDTGTRDGSETAWSGTGAGCSAYEAKPTWQHDSGCANRTVADVSAVANPETGVWVYDTFGGGNGWNIYGGTSVAAPIVASLFALAGNPLGSSGSPASYLYSDPSALYDVTSGSDGKCSPSYLCTAGVGYDGPTGLGTPGGSPSSIAAFRATNTPPEPTGPGAPGTLGATAGDEQVALSWSAPATGSAPFTYNVYESTTSSTAGFSPVSSATGLTGTSFTVTGLTNGEVYYFKVTAKNSVTEGGASNVASATPTAPAVTSLPGAPTDLKATASSRGIDLSWHAPASDGGSEITSYELYRGLTAGRETPYETVRCTASICTTVDSATAFMANTFFYEVAAVNSVGTGARSNEAFAKG
jgi:subtilase family serine protease